MRYPLLVAVVVASCAGCSRDLTLPPPPGPLQPGTLSGRVVFAEAGSNLRRPAVGAGIELLTTSISAIADADGRFVLSGINQTEGAVLIRFGLKPDGTFSKQRLLRLEAIGAGPGHDISLGEISVVENAQIRGKVLRSNIVTTGGHAGTTIFVPEGPFATSSADDGSFLLPALPEGTISLLLFRPGYLPVSLDELQLRSGEELTVRLVSLEVDPAPQTPARVAGSVVTSPPLSDLSAGSVELTTPGSGPLVTALSASGTFELAAVPAGVYAVAAKHPGYTTATLYNLFVASGGNYTLAQITLTTSPLPPQPDAGQVGGADGGSGDGGTSINANLPPIAHAGPDTVIRIGSAGQLNAGGSVDPESAPLRYLWTELSDAGVTLSANNSLLAVSPTFTAPSAAKVLKFQLTVTDDGDLVDTDEVTVEVLAPPVARITPQNIALAPGQSVTFSSAGSFDPTGAPLTFTWAVIPPGNLLPASGTGTTFTVTAQTGASGAANVRLIASNAFLDSNPADSKVVFGNGAAVASAGMDQDVNYGATVSLSAVASSTNPSSTFTYAWTQLSGAAVTLTGASTATPTFLAPSSDALLAFQVTASGSNGESAVDDVQVSVKDLTGPTVVSSDPPNLGTGSPLFATVSFNEQLAPSSVTPSNIWVEDGSSVPVPANLTYDNVTKKVTISYAAPLTVAGSYTLRVVGVTDATAQANLVTAYSASFNARGFNTQLFQDTATTGQATLSTTPYILWTPNGVYVVGRRQTTALVSYQSYFWVWKVNEGGSSLDTLPYITTNNPVEDNRYGDPAPRALRTGSSWFALGGQSPSALQLYNTAGGVFTATAGWLGSHALTDGITAWTTYENYGVNVRPHQPSGNTFGPEQKLHADCCRTNRISGEGDGNSFYVSSWANGTSPMAFNRKTWIFKNQGGSWSKFGEAGTGTPTDVLMGRTRVHKGLPVVVQPESVGGNYQVRAYGYDSTGGAMVELGGGAVNSVGSVTVFDAAVLSDTVYVALLVGQEIRIKRALIGAGSTSWVDVAGPGPGGVMNVNTTCAADRPSLDAAPDGLWLAWTESCGGTTDWKPFARKIY